MTDSAPHSSGEDPLTAAEHRRMRRLRHTLRISALVFLVIGLACAALSLPTGISELQRAQSQSAWIPVEGTVVRFEPQPERFPLRSAPITVERPVIEYRVNEVTRYYIHPRATDLDYPLGAPVLLRYDRADPALVTYDRGQTTYLAPLLLGTMPLLFGLILGAVMWIRSGDQRFLRLATRPGD
ncbi:DUF3592 domain-containing protein [Naumannella halotolerans]|uniref:Uncharacterized protein DUF3592 n=1 Tax=Naumannella halotolerans TaxID=993414 RepID=A0A4R7JAF3_9ACTN|nr:DUF3592 domain-containing protein [Naumannella halotolerans]TDT34552.1 uncharacterized protein DUF3592 [Naumannella halotolerans]